MLFLQGLDADQDPTSLRIRYFLSDLDPDLMDSLGIILGSGSWIRLKKYKDPDPRSGTV
jgi:hypothetical protein